MRSSAARGTTSPCALKTLGRSPVRPVTLLGGAVGRHCEDLLRTDDGFDPLVTPTEAPTRVILTVRTEGSPDQSAFFDPDPAITPQEAEALIYRVEGAMIAETISALTLSGSSPAASTHGIFSDLVALAQSRKIPAFLDTYGPALKAIWGFWPEVIQLNRREAASHLGRKGEPPGDGEILGLLDSWIRRGVAAAVVTDGPNPVLARVGGRSYRVSPPEIVAVNPIGSGDCLLAGMVDGWLAKLEPEALLRHAVGCAVANALVWDAGAIDPEEVRRRESEVVVEPIAGR